MHIAYLTPEYPHEKTGHAGGMGTSIKNLVKQIVNLGNEVTVFVYGQDQDEVFSDKGIQFHKIKLRQYSVGGFYKYRKHIQQYVNNNDRTIDIIEAPDWTGITAFMNLNKPLVIRFHGSDTYFCHVENRKQKWKNRFFEKKAMNKAVAFIAPTHYAADVSSKLFHIERSKVKVIHYGLELEYFENDSPSDYKKYNLLNIGTVIRKKGMFQLAQMFNELVKLEPKATLTLIGADSPDISTGSDSTWQLIKKEFSKEALVNVTYLGKIPYEEVQEHIKNAHVCVFPSLAETLGMVTIESMALKKVVVNTDIGWAQDLIRHAMDGYMHHPNDINSYVETIAMLFEDEHLIEHIGNNARKSVERKFDIKKLAHQNIDFYQSIIKDRS